MQVFATGRRQFWQAVWHLSGKLCPGDAVPIINHGDEPRLNSLMNENPCNLDEIRAFNRRGLFLGGAPKSGTSLLLSLLDGHPDLVVLPEETHFLEERAAYSALDGCQARLRRLLEKRSEEHTSELQS